MSDNFDAFPLDVSESIDTDGDGIGNNADSDDDNDGVSDNFDAFPLNANESVDTDSDGVGNNADPDDDNDGVTDLYDVFSLDFTEWVDTDFDNVGNNSDLDDDNDGVEDINDAFPLDSSESVDTDADGIGDNSDNCPVDANPNQADLNDDGIGDDCSDPVNVPSIGGMGLFILGLAMFILSMPRVRNISISRLGCLNETLSKLFFFSLCIVKYFASNSCSIESILQFDDSNNYIFTIDPGPDGLTGDFDSNLMSLYFLILMVVVKLSFLSLSLRGFRKPLRLTVLLLGR